MGSLVLANGAAVLGLVSVSRGLQCVQLRVAVVQLRAVLGHLCGEGMCRLGFMSHVVCVWAVGGFCEVRCVCVVL